MAPAGNPLGAGLQRREDIVTWQKSAVDLERNTLTVSPGKTQGYDNPAHLRIVMSKALREVVLECMRSPVASPFLIHYRPMARNRDQIKTKEHWTSVTPNYLTNAFTKTRDEAHAYDQLPADERPTFHEIRALGSWLYEQQNFPQEYIQTLLGHADEKMPKHYQEGHTEQEILYVDVSADLAF
jgi:integrase